MRKGPVGAGPNLRKENKILCVLANVRIMPAGELIGCLIRLATYIIFKIAANVKLTICS